MTYFQRCRNGCFYISECVKAKAIHAGFSECSNLAAQAVCMRARFNMCRYTFVLRGCSDTQCVICRFNMLAGIFLCFRLFRHSLCDFRFNMCRYISVLKTVQSLSLCDFRFNMLAGIFLCFRLCSDTHCVILGLTFLQIYFCA